MKKLIILLAIAACSTPPPKEEKAQAKPLSNPDKVLAALQDQFGSFDEVEYYDADSLNSWYSYRGHAVDRTDRAKGIIDKTMNLVGADQGPSPIETVYNVGSYIWETPTEKIEMRGAVRLGKDTSSYLSFWITRK